jgi:hypothetical protein
MNKIHNFDHKEILFKGSICPLCNILSTIHYIEKHQITKSNPKEIVRRFQSLENKKLKYAVYRQENEFINPYTNIYIITEQVYDLDKNQKHVSNRTMSLEKILELVKKHKMVEYDT